MALLAASGLSSCTIPPPEIDAGAVIARAIPTAGLVEFRTLRGPVDEGRADSAALTLHDAIRRAFATDPGLQAALARTHIELAAATEAGLPPDPVLSVVLREPSGGGPAQVEAGLTGAVVSLLQTPRRAGAAHHRLRAEVSRALVTALDLLQDVQTRYAGVQALEALRELLAERRDTVQRLLDVTRARLEVGEATRAETVAFGSELLAIELELAERLGELRRERLALSRLLGEPSGAADWTVDAFEPPALDLGDEAAWIARALECRPDIRAAEWELLAREDELALARASPFASTELGVEGERDGNWAAGPGLSVPLSLSGRSDVRLQSASARHAEAGHILTETQRIAVSDVRSAFAVMSLSTSGVERLRSELLPLIERRRADVQRAFEARELDISTLLLVDQALQESRSRLLELERQAALSLYQLQRAVGGNAALESARTITNPGDDDDAE